MPVDTLQCDPANLRLHGERSLEGIKASLQRFGQRKPIVVDAGGVTIAGAGLLTAAKALGWSHVAATRHEDLTGAERVAYAIADNRTAELSEWDKDALKATLGAANPEDLASMGYSADEFANLVHPDDATVQDEIPEPLPDPVSQRGDLWLLGEQRLLCGDCTDTADVRRVMAGELARLVATDPPYLVGYDGTNHARRKGARKVGGCDWSSTYAVAWDDADKNSDLYPKFLAAAMACAAHEDAAWYCWHASSRYPMLEAAWTGAGLLAHCQIIWVKNRGVPSRTWFAWQHEPCLMGWKKGHKPMRIEDEPILSTVWPIDAIPNTEDRPDHPTPKPLECYAIPFRQHTKRGDVVYEPFAGSGTAIVVAEQLGRRCRAIEISPVYCDVVVRRWQKLSGKPAVLDGDGRSWAEVQAERSTVKPCPPAPSTPAPKPAARRSRTAAGARSTQG